MVDRIRKLLIANRGEIAIRIMRTCKKLGIKTVAIYTHPDRDSLHIKYADEAYYLGSDPYGYLDVEKIVSIARRSGVDAVHPGYGFLSEKAVFAKAVEDSGIIWIGPPWRVIELLESKSRTRAIASELGVPVIPGTLEPVSIDIAKRVAEKIGFPILIKADRGGGGRGIRVVNSLEEFEYMYEIAVEEMKTAFGSDKVYIEKFIPRARHIELQILADKHGNIVVLGERECSIQRRYQKIIEEAPSPIVTDRDRDYLYELAVKFMRRVGYVNAGTMEFLRDTEGRYYLIEVNKRIQVEHPVTEMVTGIDIVEQQIKIAEGRELEVKNHMKNFNGHAIEARVYAEDPEKMIPSPGTITFVKFPSIENIRIDHAIAQGITITPFYDPMIAKVIAWGRTRNDAINKLIKALREFQIDGIKTSIPLLIKILSTEEFINGNIDVQFFDRFIRSR